MTDDKKTQTRPEREPEPQPDSISHPISPDALMSDFKGKPFFTIVLFTLVAHVLFVGVFSIGYLKEAIVGVDTSGLSDEQKLEQALKKSDAELRTIADRYGVSVTDLKSKIGSGRKPATPAPPPAEQDAPDKPADPGSEYEQDLNAIEAGPKEPDLTGGIEEEEDPFAQPDAP